MNARAGYREYVADADFAAGYLAYQRRYADEPRESDRVTVGIVRDELARMGRLGGGDVLDAGCSTGNLLRHLARGLPDARLIGGDLMASHLAEAARDPELGSAEFRRLDLVDLGLTDAFDVVVANAVIYLFDDPTLEAALDSIRRALRPGGAFVAFDFVHGFRQELAIREVSDTHPGGLTLHMRSESSLRHLLANAGLSTHAVRPFRIKIDLDGGEDPADIVTRTIDATNGERMLFRGALFQPWAHVVARRDDG